MDTILILMMLTTILVFGVTRMVNAVARFREKQTLKGIRLALAGLVLIGLPIALLLPYPGRDRGLHPRWRCQSNLHQLDLALAAHCYPPVNFYPTNLNELCLNNVSPRLFVCPGSGNEPGDMTNVMEWTDYIYLAGASPATEAGVPIAVCPPENHEDEGSCYLDSDHGVKWVPKEHFNALLVRMYGHADLNDLCVMVSKRLQKQCKGKYRSSRRSARRETNHEREIPTDI